MSWGGVPVGPDRLAAIQLVPNQPTQLPGCDVVVNNEAYELGLSEPAVAQWRAGLGSARQWLSFNRRT